MTTKQKYIKRPARIFFDKDRKKYIVYKKQRIYLDEHPKSVIKKVIKKAITKIKRKPRKKGISKKVKEYLKGHITGETKSTGSNTATGYVSPHLATYAAQQARAAADTAIQKQHEIDKEFYKTEEDKRKQKEKEKEEKEREEKERKKIKALEYKPDVVKSIEHEPSKSKSIRVFPQRISEPPGIKSLKTELKKEISALQLNDVKSIYNKVYDDKVIKHLRDTPAAYKYAIDNSDPEQLKKIQRLLNEFNEEEKIDPGLAVIEGDLGEHNPFDDDSQDVEIRNEPTKEEMTAQEKKLNSGFFGPKGPLSVSDIYDELKLLKPSINIKNKERTWAKNTDIIDSLDPSDWSKFKHQIQENYVDRKGNPIKLKEVEESLSGQGINNDRDEKVLTDQDINNIMSPFKDYISAISSDELGLIYNYLTMYNPKVFSFIINTLPRWSNEVGHWIAIYVNMDDECTVELYDPLVNEHTKELESKIVEMVKDYLDEMVPNHYLKLKINEIQQQSTNSSNCGWFAMRFLIMRYNHLPFSEATGFKGIQKNEHNIRNMQNNFEEWGYI